MIVFCIILIIVILITILLPRLLVGPELAVNFRYITFPLLIFIVLVLGFMSVFFILNYRRLSLLEREDWPALSYYMERQIYTKGRYSSRNVRLLASSYLVISDYQSVLKLESKALHIKPSVIEKNALLFGVAKILSGNNREASQFFNTYLDKGSANDRQWIRWYYGFTQLLNNVFDIAESELTALALSSDNAIITGLSAYFLESSISKYSLKYDECRAAAENGRSRVLKTLANMSFWKKEANQMEADIHVAIIKKYIEEAGNWIYGI
jgi:hypothetical protein